MADKHDYFKQLQTAKTPMDVTLVKKYATQDGVLESLEALVRRLLRALSYVAKDTFGPTVWHTLEVFKFRTDKIKLYKPLPDNYLLWLGSKEIIYEYQLVEPVILPEWSSLTNEHCEDGEIRTLTC